MREYVKPVCKNLTQIFDRIMGGAPFIVINARHMKNILN